MKFQNRTWKKSLGIFWLLLTLVFAPGFAWAGNIGPSAQEISQGAVENAKKTAQNIQAKLSQDAVKAIEDTHKALTLLDQGKIDQAVKVLQDAVGRLEVVLAANPKMAYVPVNVSTVAFDLEASPKEIKDTLNQVKKFLKQGEVQKARQLLDTLQSEIDIIIEKLPLATYPDTIKLAVKYIAQGKIEEAKTLLGTALSSLVQDVVVIPLPIVRADMLIQAASKVVKTDKQKAVDYLNRAERELTVAKLLGYGKQYSQEYQDLINRIEALKKEIKGKNHSAKMFEELLTKFKAFRKHFEKEKTQK